MISARHYVDERVRILRGSRSMFVQADTIRRGDIICDQLGLPLRDKKRRRRTAAA